LEHVLSAFIATLVTLPIIGYLIVFILTKQWTRNHRKAVQYGLNSSTILFIISVHLMIQSIFGVSLLWLVISIIILLSVIVVLVHLQLKGEIDYTNLLRGSIRLNALFFILSYFVLVVVGVTKNILELF